MSKYVENQLGKNEVIVLKAKKNFLALFGKILFLVIMIVVMLFLKSETFTTILPDDATNEESVKTLIGFIPYIPLVIGIIIFLIGFINFACLDLAVTNKRILGKIGVFNVKAIDYHIDKVDNVSMSSTFWGSIFQFQTISVRSTNDDVAIKFGGISNANMFKNKINEAIEQHTDEVNMRLAKAIAEAIFAQKRIEDAKNKESS